MLRLIFGAISLCLILSCNNQQASSGPGDAFLNGADISSLPDMEHYGASYADNGGEADVLTILKRHGFNSIRLKLWHTPKRDFNTLAQVAAMARRIKAHDMHFLLNFHYSDWWADPQKQIKPKAWQDIDFPVLRDSLYQYSRHVLTTLKNQGTPPQMVQIGNEIRPGMLWPDGRVDGEWDTDAQWDRLAELLTAARQGVLDGLGDEAETRIMIHFDNGGDNPGCRYFYDQLSARKVQFDVIGLSFYPKWHGTLQSLAANLTDLSQRFNKDVIVVETAYPWTMEWNDEAGNIMGSETDLHEGYPPTVEGQVAFFTELRRIVTSVPGGKGIGLYYWEPAWISAPGRNSAWENVALFDFDGQALPAMDAFTGRN